MQIMTNIASLNSYNRLNKNQRQQSTNMERLASGFRINRAADDAAGLAISKKMDAQSRGTQQAQRNVQDGVSLIQTADKGLENILEPPLHRMRELAIQASNDTYTDEDRQAMQEEFDEMKNGIDDIAHKTEFNTQKLLSLEESEKTDQINGSNGVDETGEVEPVEEWRFEEHDSPVASITADNEGYIYSGSGGGNVRKIDSYGNEIWKVDNHSILVSSVAVDDEGNVYSGSWDNTLRKMDTDGNESWNIEGQYENVDSIAVDNDGYIYIGESGWGDYSVRKIDPDTGEEVWSFDEQASTVHGLALDDEGNVYSGSSFGIIRKIDSDTGEEEWLFYEQDDTTYGLATDNENNIYSGSNDGTVRKIDSDGNNIWTYDGHDTSVNSIAVDNENNIYSGSLDGTVRKIDPDGNQIWKFEGQDEGTNSVAVDDEGNVYSGVDGTVIKISQQPLKAEKPDSKKAKPKSLTLQVGPNSNEHFDVELSNVITEALNIDGASISTREDAQEALGAIDEAIGEVSSERGKYGAYQNRLEHINSNLMNYEENITAARSRIKDADMAKEMSEYTQRDILKQAGTAMLSQANLAPQSVLQLIN